MDLKELVGKVFKVQIIEKRDDWYIANIVNKKVSIYIEDTGDFEEKELLETIQKCIVVEVKEEKLIGFLLANRKFVNDIKKIDKNLKDKEEHNKIQDIYLMERLKIKGKVVGLYLVDEGDIGKYYLDTVEIGIYVKKLRENNIRFKENTVENELAKQIKDVVQSIDLSKKEISLIEEREKEKHLIEKALDLEIGREITRIVTLDLKQKVEVLEEKIIKEI